MALPQNFSSKQFRGAYRDCWSEIEPTDTVWLLTWNPSPKFYSYDKYGNNDYEMQWRTMLDVILGANRCLSNYAFVAEVSDAGKLHLHGFYVIKDKVKLHKSFLPTLRRNGYIKINKASSKKWKTFEYHVKDLSSTVQYILANPVVITPYNRDSVRKQLTLYKSLVAHDYGPKEKIKKRNVMTMMSFIMSSEEESSSE